MDASSNAAFETIARFIKSPLEFDIADDLNGEQETHQGNILDEAPGDGNDDADADAEGALADITEYQSRLLAVSKAVTERTAYEYEM